MERTELGLSSPESGANRRVVALATWLGVTAAFGLVPMRDWHDIDIDTGIPAWVLVVAFVLTEVAVAHLRFGSHHVSFSLSEVPITLSFVTLSPLHAVSARLVGSLIGLSAQRVRGVKLWFNLASGALEMVAATALYRWCLGGADPLGPRGWFAALAAAAAVDLLSGATISTAMSLHGRRFDRREVVELLVTGLATALTNCCLAIIMLIVIDFDARASVALGVIGAALFVAYRSWARQARRFDQLESVYGYTRAIESAPDVAALASITLNEIRRLIGCAEARLTLISDGVPITWTSSDVGEPVLGGPMHPGDADPFVTEPIGFAERGPRRIALPIRSARSTHGHLVVAGPGEATSFGASEHMLLETISNHLAVELDNSTLLDQLRVEAAHTAHVAAHDALTGLANRRRFVDEVDECLTARTPRAAVLLMDLDRFKEVNDALGHRAGDVVLVTIAQRLESALGSDAIVARLGGDEFAVLVRTADVDHALSVAERTLAAVQVPIRIDEVTVDVAGSIGVALAPAHGDDAESLLRRADVAMYVAKDRQTRVEVYSSERDLNDLRRLHLVAELRRAIEARELTVQYQPQFEIGQRRFSGVEALVRWTSKQYGPVRPDEFVAIAECTGQISALTVCVIDVALEELAAWRALGWAGTMSVNMSSRSLGDDALIDHIAAALARHGLQPADLTVEITETSLMRDFERNVAALRRLDSLGIQLAIDDFGTGYSSLAYLKQLPVQELKIDRSFIQNLELDESDRSIVRATTRLAHELGLHVVAEGVETAASLELLAAWDVDIAQGYYFSRPVTSSEIRTRITNERTTLRAVPTPLARSHALA